MADTEPALRDLTLDDDSDDGADLLVKPVRRSDAQAVFLGIGPSTRQVCLIVRDSTEYNASARAAEIDAFPFVVYSSEPGVTVITATRAAIRAVLPDFGDDDQTVMLALVDDPDQPCVQLERPGGDSFSWAVLKAERLPQLFENIVAGAPESAQDIKLTFDYLAFPGATMSFAGVMQQLAERTAGTQVRVETFMPSLTAQLPQPRERHSAFLQFARFIEDATTRSLPVHTTWRGPTRVEIDDVDITMRHVKVGRDHFVVARRHTTDAPLFTTQIGDRPPPTVYTSPAVLTEMKVAPTFEATCNMLARVFADGRFSSVVRFDPDTLTATMDTRVPAHAWESAFLAFSVPYVTIESAANASP